MGAAINMKNKKRTQTRRFALLDGYKIAKMK
jgi:hypothetical protein